MQEIEKAGRYTILCNMPRTDFLPILIRIYYFRTRSTMKFQCKHFFLSFSWQFTAVNLFFLYIHPCYFYCISRNKIRYNENVLSTIPLLFHLGYEKSIPHSLSLDRILHFQADFVHTDVFYFEMRMRETNARDENFDVGICFCARNYKYTNPHGG